MGETSKNFALVGASILLCLICAEGGLRIYSRYFFSYRGSRELHSYVHLRRPSTIRELGYELFPNLSVRVNDKSFTTNAFGQRGWPTTLEKPSDVYRIAGIGDSVLMGSDVNDDETYLSRLEKALNENLSGRKVETINFGVTGYNTEQEFYMLKYKSLSFKPDFVILGYTGNDQEDLPFKYCAIRFSSPSYFLNISLLAWTKLRLPAAGICDWRPSTPVKEPLCRNFEASLRRIFQLLRDERLAALVVLDSRYESWGLTHTRIESIAAQYGVPSLNLLRMYRKLPEHYPIEKAITIEDEHYKNYVIKLPDGKSGHPNSKWHERTAAEIAEKLRSNPSFQRWRDRTSLD